MLSYDNFIQGGPASPVVGSFNGSSGPVTLPQGTQAGSTVIIAAGVAGTGFEMGTDSFYELTAAGFTRISTELAAIPTRSNPFVFAKRNVAADETEFTLNVSPSAQLVAWAAFEVVGVGLDPLVEWTVAPGSVATDSAVTTSRSTGSTPVSSCFDTVALALFVGSEASSGIPAFSGYTNGYEEIAETGTSDANHSIDASVAVRFSSALEAAECTANNSPAAWTRATVVVLYADGARHAPDIQAMFGAGIGTANGLAIGSAGLTGQRIFDENNGAAVVSTAVGETGYCLELSGTSVIRNVAWTAATFNTFAPTADFPAVPRINVLFPGSLPSADVELAWIEVGSIGNGGVLWYRAASQKLELVIGSGTGILSDSTVAADDLIGVDLRYDPRGTTHLCDWAVEYDTLGSSAGPVEQTQASGSGMTAGTITRYGLGWPNARTATVRYFNLLFSKSWGAYPLRYHKFALLKVDPAGTPSVVGDPAKFKFYTDNTTMNDFTAAGALAAMDEVPPVFGATSDGIAQVTAANTDYVKFPMATFTFAPLHVPRAARLYLPGWADAASSGACNIGYEVWTGSEQIVTQAAAQHGFDRSSSGKWLARMLRSFTAFYNWTQAKIDGLELRLGYSNDTTPDAGYHGGYIEVAYQAADVYRVSDHEDGMFTLDVRQDPYSQAVASLVGVSNHASRGATITATINGEPYTTAVDPLETKEWPIGAGNNSEVTQYGLIPG